MFLAIASICMKSYVFEMRFIQYITELAIIILSTLYISVRGVFLGYNSSSNSKRSKVLAVLTVVFLSFAVSISSGLKNYSLYGDNYNGIFDVHFLAGILFTFISSAILISVIIALLYGIDKAGQRRLEKKLHEEDE